MGYQFDVAISYKSEMEETASIIYDYLRVDGWKVFFAPDQQQMLLSEKIHEMLYDIYKNKSLMKVLLVSESYLDGKWTSLEKRVSLESTKEERKRLLIVNYTNQENLPGDLKDLFCMGKDKKEDEIACMITEQLKLLKQKKDKTGNSRKKSHSPVGNITINNSGGIIAGDHARISNIRF